MLLRKRNAWLLAFAFFLGSLAMLWQFKMRSSFEESGRLGDGKSVASYGFALDSLRVRAEDIVPSGVPRDGLNSLDMPALLDAAALDSVNALGRKPFLFGHDRVIGLVVGGEARAYPISILNWHELVNDSLGGEPVLVTWNPLCGAAAAYARPDGSNFSVSGLFYASNLILYDRRSESLWSQLTGRALAGSAAAAEDSLRRLPALLTRWDDWLERHPTSSVIAPNPVWLKKKYRRRPYVSYEGSDRLQYPVRRQPATGEGELRLKTPMLSVWAGGERRLYPLSLIAEHADADGRWRIRQGDADLQFRYWSGNPAVAVVDAAEGQPLTAVQAYWFAWFAQESDAAALLFP
jgi:hypothetical protein